MAPKNSSVRKKTELINEKEHKKNRNFVGRKSELNEFRKMVVRPYGGIRVLLLVGSGGIGKTKIVERLLDETALFDVLVPDELLDFSATELRSIDGIQWKIVEIIEGLTSLTGEQSPFAEFRKKNQETSEQFNACLRNFCKKHPLLIAFDTLEVLGAVAMNWIFEAGNEGLQVPGLVCIIAGRLEKEVKENLQSYKSKPHVKVCSVSGLSLSETVEFYQKVSNEFNRLPQDDLFSLAGGGKTKLPYDGLREEDLEWVWKITEGGHPLRLEMAIRWVVLSGTNLKGVTVKNFEEKLMKKVDYDGKGWALRMGSVDVSRAVFETLLCMGYVTRRFDEKFLSFLTKQGFIPRGKSKAKDKEILENLEKYFFVKTRDGDEPGLVFQLHDEMARLVREYLWRNLDPSGEKKRKLLTSIIKFYNQLIKSAKKNEILQKTLRVEQLYYVLQRDSYEGKRLWLDLIDLDDPYLNSLLPSEVNEYKTKFDPESRYQIHYWVAQLEFSAGHINQARREWNQVKALGEREKQSKWVVDAYLGLARCERNAGEEVKVLKGTMALCKDVPEYLPKVKHNIGFAYRKMQNVEKAIEWYKKAREDFRKNSRDKFLGARITNDLGYAYSHVGDWEECLNNVKEGQQVRQTLVRQFEKEVKDKEQELRFATDKGKRSNLRDELRRAKIKLSKGRFQLGLSLSTLGEVYRHREDLPASFRNYTDAIKLFTDEKVYKWQAKSLFSRGETYRRIAMTMYKEGHEEQFLKNIELAKKDIELSLTLTRKHRLKDERDTANRRMGRVLHDLALYEIDHERRKAARTLLDLARHYFELGLDFAQQTNDGLEELSNLTELAFIYDDYLRITRRGKIPPQYSEALNELKHALDKHQNKPFPIYQISVFENLYEMEKAAIEYREGRYDLARDGYLKAYTALAADPGYGRTKYRSLFRHLAVQIENLPAQEVVAWCNSFLEKWENNSVIIRRRKTTLAQESILPDMVQWCWEQLKKKELEINSLAGASTTDAPPLDSKKKNIRKG